MEEEHSGDEGMEEQRPRRPFPTFLATRQRHHPDSPLFLIGNTEREVYAKQESMRLSAAEREQLLRSVVSDSAVPVQMTNRPQCSVCRRLLPTEYLLSLHIAESHDSFFAAQVARGLKVYECLVESCGRKFSCPNSRKQHLLRTHHFPKCFDFDAMHVKRCRKGNKPNRQREGRDKQGAETQGRVTCGGDRQQQRMRPRPLNQEEGRNASAMDIDGLTAAVSRMSAPSRPQSASFGRRGRGRAGMIPRQIR